MENIPEGLNYSENAPFHLSLFQGWMNLLNMAKKSVDIVSSHWDLNHSHPSACQVSCILYVCAGFIYVHFTLLSSLASTPQVQADMLCAINHEAQPLLECLAFKGKVMFRLYVLLALL